MVGEEEKIVRIFFVRNFFGSEKNLGLKEEFGLKKTFVGNFFWSEGQGWHFRGPEKDFAFFFIRVKNNILCRVLNFYQL